MPPVRRSRLSSKKTLIYRSRVVAGPSPSEINIDTGSGRRRRQHMSADAKAQSLEKVEASQGSKRPVLSELGISKSDCYRWRARQQQGSLENRQHPGPSWVYRLRFKRRFISLGSTFRLRKNHFCPQKPMSFRR